MHTKKRNKYISELNTQTGKKIYSWRSISKCYKSSEKDVPSACIIQNLELIIPQSTAVLPKSPLAHNNIPHILWNPKDHYCVHSSPQLVPTLGQMNPVQILPSCHFKSIFKLGVPIHQCHHWHRLLLRATKQHMLAPSSASLLYCRSEVRGSIFLQNSNTLLLIHNFIPQRPESHSLHKVPYTNAVWWLHPQNKVTDILNLLL